MDSKTISNGIVRAFATIVLTVLLLYTLYLLRAVLIYLVVSVVVTLIGKPLIHLFYKKLKINNLTVCIIFTMGILVIVGLGIFSLFIPLLISQGKNLSGLDINLLRNNLDGLISRIFNMIGIENNSVSVAELLNFINIGDLINSFISFIGDFGIGFVSVLFISFFFMKDGEKMLISFLKIMPTRRKNKIKVSIFKVNNLLSRYFIGLMLQILVLFVMYTITLLIFGVENAFIIAILGALLNLIPYVGPIISFFLIGLLTMSSNLHLDFMSVTLPTTIYVLIGFLVCQLVDNFVSQPIIYSNSVKSTPLEIFLITLISGTLFGIVGMTVAIPTYTVIKVVLKEFFPANKWVMLFTKNI